MKPNCYECKYRGNVPGDAHSCCKHPSNTELLDNPLMNIFAIFASVQRMPPMDLPNAIHVRGNPHGINHGWFNYPFNFDPNWLEECTGFVQKETK